MHAVAPALLAAGDPCVVAAEIASAVRLAELIIAARGNPWIPTRVAAPRVARLVWLVVGRTVPAAGGRV